MTRLHKARVARALSALAVAACAGAVAPGSARAQASAAPAAPAAMIGSAAGAADTTATADSGAPVRRGGKEAPVLSFDREVYSYSAQGRRDPFQSLMATGELRPLISELRLVAIAYDATGGGSVAVLRDIGTNEQYRVRAGQQLGRMRVAAIQPKKVVFTIEEFGFSRQESLALGDLTNARTQQ